MKELFHNVLLSMAILLSSANVNAQNYIAGDKGSNVTFKIVNHLIVTTNVTGHLKGLKGNIRFNASEPQNASFDASVSIATITTGIGKRDKDLKKEEFFNVDKFPEIHFRSSAVEKGKMANAYIMTGELTMKGITRRVQIPFTAIPEAGGYRFKADFRLNRLDYSVGSKGKIEDTLNVILDVFARKV